MVGGVGVPLVVLFVVADPTASFVFVFEADDDDDEDATAFVAPLLSLSFFRGDSSAILRVGVRNGLLGCF